MRIYTVGNYFLIDNGTATTVQDLISNVRITCAAPYNFRGDDTPYTISSKVFGSVSMTPETSTDVGGDPFTSNSWEAFYAEFTEGSVAIGSLPLPPNASTSALQTEISTKLDGIVASFGGMFDLNQAAALGLVEGLTDASFLGLNTSVGSTNETCCDFSGVLVPLTVDTQLYASSSSASDTANTLIVTGVTADYEPVTRTVTLNGQNQVALDGLMFFADNATSLNGTGLVGTVYIATASALTGGVPTAPNAIKSQINLDTNFSPTKSNGTTRNGFRIVTAGKTMILTRLKPGTGKNDDAFFTFGVKFPGLAEIFPSSLNVYQALDNIPVAFALTPGSVIQAYVRTPTGSIQTVCGVDAVFIDNEIFGLD
jgi:hypothetical protein